jgi:hypothetical protein
MAQSCTYARNTNDGNIQGKVIFGAITPTSFTINSVQTTNAMTMNNVAFTNGGTPALTSTYLGYSVPFTIANVPQGSTLQVTAGGPNANTPTIFCTPQITCSFGQSDTLGVEAKGSFTQSSGYIPLTFQPNGQSTAGQPYFVTLNGLQFVNGKNGGIASGNNFTFKTSGLPMQSLSINNFRCVPILSTSDPIPSVKGETFRSQPWFWDLMTVLFLSIVWTYFYFYILKPRGQGFHFEFLKKKSIVSSTSSNIDTNLSTTTSNTSLTSSVD